MDTSRVYRVQDPYILRSWEEVANKSFIFTKDGIRIIHDVAIAENDRCSKNALGFLQTYKPGDILVLDSSRTFDLEIQKWHTLAGTPLAGVPAKGKDLTIVYYWNSFSGNPNHRNYFIDAHKIIATRNDLDIVFYKINQDLREGMDIEKCTQQHQAYKDSLRNAQAEK